MSGHHYLVKMAHKISSYLHTNFSTFSLEAANLFEKKAYFSGGCYIAMSVLGCVIGVYCGKKIAMILQR